MTADEMEAAGVTLGLLDSARVPRTATALLLIQHAERRRVMRPVCHAKGHDWSDWTWIGSFAVWTELVGDVSLRFCWRCDAQELRAP